jgi:ribosome-binding factor A
MKDRISQVNSLIRDELAKFLSEFLEVPIGTLVTIVRVESSIDLYYATVYISVLPKENEEKILSKINRFIRGIQKHLNQRLEMKYVPQLRFKIDHEEEKQAQFEKLLGEVKEVKGSAEEQ